MSDNNNNNNTKNVDFSTYQALSTTKAHLSKILSNLSGIALQEILNKPATFVDAKTKEQGDLVFNMNMLKGFKYKMPDNTTVDQLAQKWASETKPEYPVTKISADKSFLFFTIDKTPVIKDIIGLIAQYREKFGHTEQGKGKTIIVEYSSPNIAKSFHLGHLRSTILGHFIKLIHQALGHKVLGINYLGDWGKQFGLLAVGFQKHGDREKLKKDAIGHLLDVYIQINQDAKKDENLHEIARELFSKMEQGDEEALTLWKEFREYSVENLEKTYGRMGIKFDIYSGESFQSEEMKKQEQALIEKNLVFEDKGATLVDLSKWKMGKVLIKKANGSSLYITRDIAAAFTRYHQYKFDKMYYVVAHQQELHFKQLFKILELMGYDWAKNCVHIAYGMVQTKNEKGEVGTMSTRQGKSAFLTGILDESKEHMFTQMKRNEKKFAEVSNPEQVSDILGQSAVYVQDFSAQRLKNYIYTPKKMTSFEGHTGPYLQFAHARLSGILEKGDASLNFNANLELLTESEGQDLVLSLGKFPAVLQNAFKQLEPSLLLAYLFEVSHYISVCHQIMWVKNQEKDLAEARLLMYWAAKQVLANGMKILGLIPLDRM